MPMTGGGGLGEVGSEENYRALNVIVAQKSSELPSAFLPPSPPSPLPPGDKWWPIPNKQKVDKKIIKKKNQNETRQADAVWPPQTGNRRL